MRLTLLLLACALAAPVFAQRPQPAREVRLPALDARNGAPGARYPSLAPDARTVVFSLHGDLWSMPVEGGRATRLTMHESYDAFPIVTPDGKSIVFASDRSGSYDVWVMPIEGGTPRRLTWHSAPEVPTSVTRDGKWVILQSAASTDWEVWRVGIDGGTPEQLTFTGGRDGYSPDDGSTLFFVDGASDPKVQEYKGSANDRLYRQRKGEAPEHLSAYDGNSREPMLCGDGGHMWFTREVEGSFELFRLDISGGAATQLTKLGEDGMSQFTISADEKTCVFVWKFYLHSLDLTNTDAKPKLLPIRIVEDAREPRSVERNFTTGVQNADLSRDGRLVAFELNGDIWLCGAEGGDARQLTSGKFRDQHPRISPDGKWVCFYSDRSGNSDIWVIGTDGSSLRQLTNDPALDAFQNWSPDGTRIVFCSERSGNRDIWVQSLTGGQAIQLTTSPQADDDPSFSPDGTMIAFDSARTGNTDIWVMNADGSNQRRIYGTTDIEECPEFSADGRMLVFNRIARTGTAMQSFVCVTDMAGSGEARVAEGGYGKFTPDGREILYVGRDNAVYFAPAPVAINVGRKVLINARTRVLEKEEMLQAYDEATQAYGQSFYDANFHGKDWPTLVAKYRQLVEACGSREEYLYYLNRLIGELSASHSGAFGNTTRAKPYTTGGLGCVLVPEVWQRTRTRLRVEQLERGGPADKAWIRNGDYIFRINGRVIGANEDAWAALENTVGQEIALVVSDNAEGENFREVRVTPESAMAKRQRDYVTWVRKNRETTQKKSQGRVAYIHIAQMMQPNLVQFENELASPQVQSAKALVIDVRDNGGGNIHQQLIDILSRKRYAEIRFRNGMKIGQPQVHWDRPIVILINERSYSDAEVFPHAIKTLGMGTIIGTQTPGAVIGTFDITLSDGTAWRLPSAGFYNKDGTNQERNGCKPDIAVDLTPADELAGRDPQLDTAIQHLLDTLKGGASKPATDKPAEPKAPARTGDFAMPAEPGAQARRRE